MTGRLARRLNPFGLPAAARLAWWRFGLPLLLRRQGVRLGRDVRFLGWPIIQCAPGGTVRLGDRCSIISVPEYTALGVNHPVILRAMRHGAVIDIGPDCGLSGATICAAASVALGRDVLLGANVTIMDTDFHPLRPQGRRYNNTPEDIPARPVVLEDNVFVGCSTVILKGTRIGRNSVIGAGAVVSGDIPPDCIAAGNPARVVRRL